MPARALGIALTAALRTPCRMPPALRGAPSEDDSAPLLLGRRDLRGLPVGGAGEAEDGGDFPRWTGGAWPALPSMGSAHSGRHGLPPARRRAALPPPAPERPGCGPGPGAAGGGGERAGAWRGGGGRADAGAGAAPPRRPSEGGQTTAGGAGCLGRGGAPRRAARGSSAVVRERRTGAGGGRVPSRATARGDREPSRGTVRPADGPTAAWSGPDGLCPDGHASAGGPCRSRGGVGSRLPRRGAPRQRESGARPASAGWRRSCPGAGGLRHSSAAAGAAVPCGGHGEGERIPGAGRDVEKRAPTGSLGPGTPRAGAVAQYRVAGGTELVRTQGGGGTARELGQSCASGDIGGLGLGRPPLSRPVADPLGASWGHGGAPLYARGIRRETPPAGASPAPLYGSRKANQAQAVRRPTDGQVRPAIEQEGPGRPGKKRGQTAAQRLSATLYSMTPHFPVSVAPYFYEAMSLSTRSSGA
jgi:DNA polymerase-3 subunit gamma/tau